MIPEITTAIVLSIAGIYDIKYREIPEEVMYLGLILVLTGFFAEHGWILRSTNLLFNPLEGVFIALSFSAIVIAYIIYKSGFFGEGDFYGLLLAALSNPFRNGFCIFPIVYIVMINFALIMIIISLGHAAYNIATNTILRTEIPSKYKFLYLFIARPVKISDYIRKPGWWYPLGACGKYGTAFDIYSNPEDEVEKLKKLLERGECSQDDVIWVTYGVPAITYMALAYIAGIVLGDKWILATIGLGRLCG